MENNHFDAVIIGAGFYGSLISIYLKKNKGLKKVLLLESESSIMTAASSNNQARIHNGYHYPRSYLTANRSHINFSRFVDDWYSSVKKDFLSIYAIAKNNSKVSSVQFKRFCKEVEIPLKQTSNATRKLFNMNLVSDVFVTEEFIFDANLLKELILKEINSNDVKLLLNTKATNITTDNFNKIQIEVITAKKSEVFTSNYVFNCTYSSLNQVNREKLKTKTKLKHELTEIALVEAPKSLSNMGITVMDGPFFSYLPFSKKLTHSISHVRYTPHTEWDDAINVNPSDILKKYEKSTRVDRMIRDAARYLPLISKSKYIESFFEIKTILSKNDNDDGRPILFENNKLVPRYYSVLGGKIDNIYDILEKVDELFIK
jgi:hypothetical protein